MLTEYPQIEQFIESIFPSQDPKKFVLNRTNFDQEPEQNGMTVGETVFLVSAALLSLFLIGGMMVSTPGKPRAAWLPTVFSNILTAG